jgi:Ca-activated chloride channel family protein
VKWELANPWALLLLAGLPVWWYWCKRRQPALPHSLVQFVASHLPLRRGWRYWVSQGLWSLVLATVILALARPRYPDPQARVPVRALAWILALDVSGSMAEQDYLIADRPVTRMEAAKRTVKKLVQDWSGSEHQHDLIGLVTFAVFVQDLAPPTPNHHVILQMLERAEPISAPPESATNIGDALLVSLYLLQRSELPGRRILLVSDGEHNVPEEILRGARHPVEAAQLARSLGIAIDSIRIGPDPQQLDDPRVRRDAEIGRQILRDAAELTGGIFLEAPDSAALEQALSKWVQLTRPVISQPQYYRYREAYPYLAVLALLSVMAVIAWECKSGVPVP